MRMSTFPVSRWASGFLFPSACWVGLFCVIALLASDGYAQTAGEPTIGPETVKSAENALLRAYEKDNPDARLFELSLSSEAWQEDAANPALRLERMWSAASGTLLELRGLQRKGQQVSALIDLESVQLRNLDTAEVIEVLASDGGLRYEIANGKQVLRVLPSETVFLFLGPIDPMRPHSLRYKNAQGRDDSYFDRIDPQFRERYDRMFARATARDANVDEMKAFLLGFVRQDPDSRVQKVFVALIGKLRAQKTFEGYYQAFKLIKDPADAAEAQKLVGNEEQRRKLESAMADAREAEARKQAELKRAAEARQAELRKREEARLADARRQEEARQAEQRAAKARAEEERCMQNARCRQELETRRAQCVEKIQACRGQCDRVTGVGRYSGFLANLSASMLSRGCYSGCQCDSGFGNLLAKFNNATAGSETPRPKGEPSSTSRAKVFECKIYCKNSSGPVTYKRFEVASRKDAARMAEEHANQICADDGKSYASAKAFSESQCVER